MEELNAKHKKEIKEFDKNKRIALKKVKSSAGKGKKGKEKMEEAEKEWDSKLQTLQEKHQKEQSAIETTAITITEASEQPNTTAESTTTASPNDKTKNLESTKLSAKEKALAKRLRKKQNALLKEKEREEQIANEIANAPNPREIEIDAMKELYLNPHQLQIEEIPADGNCLYRAIAKQLEYLNSDGGSSNHDYDTMRSLCADQLVKSRDEYEPFADLDDSNVSSYDEYIEKVRASSEWGGHLELRALSSALDKTIVVYSADGAPLYIRNGDGDDDKKDDENGTIRLSFHRRYYALGEHYNSVIPNATSES